MAVNDNLKDIFNQIAPGWYGFRHRTIFRKELEEMARRWQKGRLINIGCAHGPDFVPFKETFDLYGIDFSSEMLKLAQKYSQKFSFTAKLILGDITRLPFADEAFDWATSVATYHHIKGERERELAFNELWRVLKPGGEAFITVWNRWQPRFWFNGKKVAVPWRTKDKVLKRYYYLFSYGELEKLARRAGFKVLKSFPESSYRLPVKLFSRNICLLVKKG
ncbi:MAG: methyltransferase domain-containing protein [Chloroflexota bacterium]